VIQKTTALLLTQQAEVEISMTSNLFQYF